VKHSKPVLVDASQAITAAVDAALADDGARTGDLGGRGNTRLFAERVVAALG
jgi:isocitrate/isopropylmalate dehydrogenase